MRSESQRIPFGKWLPDLTEFSNPGLLTAKNCIPAVGGYRALKKLASLGVPLYSDIRGYTSIIKDNGQALTVVGTDTSLNRFNGTSWEDISNPDQPYVVDNAGWDFAQFGDVLISTTLSTPPQWLDLNASASDFNNFPATPVASTGADSFPPSARHVMALRDFVVLGHFGEGNNQEKKLQWSSIGNAFGWPTPGTIEAEATQSDEQVLLNDKGEITGLIGYHEYGIIFQRRAITRMTYIGPPGIFQFDTLSDDIGAVARGGIAQFQGLVFFMSETGFYFFNGQNAVSIGQEQIDRYVLDEVDFSKRFSITSAVDPVNKTVMWTYCTKDNPTDKPDKMVMFNYEDKRWSETCFVEDGKYEEQGIRGVGLIFRPPFDLDNSDPQYPTVDDNQPDVDSEYWVGTERKMVGFNQYGQIGFFEGAPFVAEFETSDAELVPGRRAFVTEVYPYIEWEDDEECQDRDGPVELTPIGRESLLDAETFGGQFGLNKQGRIPMRWNYRYQRYHIKVMRSFRYASGIEINPHRLGRH